MDEITNNKIAVEESPAPVTTMKKRWLLTINNPIFADSGYTEINPSDTDLEVKENHYDFHNMRFFEFAYHSIQHNIFQHVLSYSRLFTVV